MQISAQYDDVKMTDCDETFIKVDGILIKQDFDQMIMSPNEVATYTSLQSLSMRQVLHVPYEHDVQVLAYFLFQFYEDVKVEYEGN